MGAGSNNALQREMAEQGDPNEYACISVQHELAPPDQSFLVSLSEVPKGTGRSDFVDALTVAVDFIYRTGTYSPLKVVIEQSRRSDIYGRVAVHVQVSLA